MRSLTIAAVFALALPAAAQDDYDLANALADRGWFDLAQDLFLSIQNSAALAVEKRAEGAYGLARMRSMEAEREANAEKKTKMYDAAIKSIKEFIDKYPNHQRRNEAYSDIGYLYQQQGKYWLSQAKVDPNAAQNAESSFDQAKKLFSELVTNLKGKKPERPELGEGGKKPPGFDEKMVVYEEWEQRIMFAKYNYGISVFSHAETLRDKPEKHGDMKRLLEQMVKYFEDDFMWDFENYILAYDAFIYMGRAYQLLAETSEPAKAEDYWKKCFNFVGKAKSLVADKELRKNDGVREVATRATFYEMKCRMAYGDTRKGGSATKQFLEAAKLAEDLFKYYPKQRDEEMGKVIRVEQARAYCKAGKIKEGQKILEEIKKENPDSPFENLAIDILGEYVGETDVRMAIDAADNYAERGAAYLYGAIAKYRKALTSIRRKEHEQFIPHCWLKIAECYFDLDRYYEAVAAATMLERSPFTGTKEGGKAALLKLGALQKISKMTNQAADKDAYNQFLVWASRTYEKEVGASARRSAALELEKKGKETAEAKKYSNEFEQAATMWLDIGKDPSNPIYGEAVFTAGFDFYRHGRELGRLAKTDTDWARVVPVYERALDQFRKYLDVYERLQDKDKWAVQYAIGSIQISMIIHVNPRMQKAGKGSAETALKMSEGLEKRFPTGDALNLMKISSMRIDAKLDLGRIEDAEEDLRSMKARYEKERLGIDSYVTALVLMAQAFEEQAAKLQDSDRAKSDAFTIKSGNYYYDVFVLDPSKFKSAQKDAVAGKFFNIAEQKMQMSAQTGDKQQESEARKFYEQARDLYTDFKDSPGVKLTDEQKSAIQRRIVRCHLQLGQFEKAVAEYEAITGRDPEKKLGSAWEDKADCYMFQAKAMSPGPQRNDLLRKADEIFTDLASRLAQLQVRNEHYWRLMYKHAEALYEYALEQLQSFFKNMDARNYAPEWDGGKWGFQVKFEDLRRRLQQKVGGGDK